MCSHICLSDGRFGLRKAFFCLFFLFIAIFSLYAQRKEVIKTKYFDVIYSPESKATATLIATHADEYALEISKRLDKKLPHRYPVYVSAKSEFLNGYYTLFPYQRIVIYDATLADGELGNSYDGILNVFYHELTHAISLWYWLPTLPLSFDEGVAVLFESRGDQGRLNDPLVHHHIMQGKLDGTTPTWRDAAGHRDTPPYTLPAYLYGASFLQYLEKIYGKDKYIKFFHNHFFIFPKEKAKKIFGKTLEELWKEFTSSISYPDNVLSPISFTKDKMDDVVLAQTEEGFVAQDSSKKSVFFYDKREKKRKLFSSSGITDLNFSPDGTNLLVCDAKDVRGVRRQRLSIFNIKRKRFLPQRTLSIRYACYARENMICAVKTRQQYCDLVLLDEHLQQQECLLSCGPGLSYSHIYSPVYAGKNKIAFIAANGLYRDVLIMDIETKEIQKLQTEGLSAIRYLRSSIVGDEVFLCFSWAGKDMLYRMALYNMKSEKLEVLEKDISGGVFQPIVFDNDDFLKLIYVGIHSKYSKLYRASGDMLVARNAELIAFDYDNAEPKSKAPNYESVVPKKYNILSWAWKVLPLPLIMPTGDWNQFGGWGVGGYFYGKDPTEFVEFSLSPLFYFKPFFMQMESRVKLDFTSFNLDFSLNDKNLDFKGRSTLFSMGTSTGFSLESINKRFYFGGEGSVQAYAKFPKDFSQNPSLYSNKYTDHFFSTTAYGIYSQTEKHHRLDSNFFAIDERGFSVALKADYLHHIQSNSAMFILQAKQNLYAPIIPFKAQIGTYYGYNACYVPSYGSFLFVQNSSFVGTPAYLANMFEYQGLGKKQSVSINNMGFSFNFSMRLFSYEIQKGSNVFLIYFNRINVEAGYRSVLNLGFANSKMHPTYYQSVYGDVYLDISGVVKLGARYSHPLEKGVVFGKFSLIFNADIFF